MAGPVFLCLNHNYRLMKKHIIILAACLALLASCRAPQCVIESSQRTTDTVRLADARFLHTIDTVIVRDSVDTRLRGDTVWVTRLRQSQRIRLVHDTVRLDSVRVRWRQVTQVRQVPRPLLWWQLALMCLGVASLLLTLFYVLRRLHR